MTDFAAQIAAYKQAIDQDITRYSDHVRHVTEEQYGEHPRVVTGEYLDLLSRGGKRIRGALTIVGYEMLGGKDKTMITRTATAMEMLHAAMLILDDVQDHSVIRRGQAAVHVALADYHRKLGLQGDPQATGTSLALNASLAGSHAAQMLLAGLSVDAELKVKVLGIISHTIVLTSHGQTYDVISASRKKPKRVDKARATEWKSAHYTFLNPLCVGMVLAGAGCEDTNAIRDYALNTGIAFQLTDDLLDGDVEQSDRAKVRRQAEEYVEQALAVLRHHPRSWQQRQVTFLAELSRYVVARYE